MRASASWREGSGRRVLAAAALLGALATDAASFAGESRRGFTFELGVAPAPRLEEARVLAGVLHLVPAGGRVGETEPRELSFDGTGSVVVDLPTGSLWRVAATAPGWWAAEEVFQAEPGGAAALTFFPTAPLSGRLRVPPHHEPPEEMRVEFAPVPPLGRPAAAAPAAPAGTVRCPVGEDGAFACEVPAGAADLTLRCAGFASEHRWAAPVDPQAGLDVGEITLRPGASLAGSLEAAGASMAAVTVELRPVTGKYGGFRTESRLESLVETTRTDPRGFFQFDGLTPGLYDVVGQAPGFAAAEVGPVRVHAGRETLLREALELHPPVTAEVRVEPALDPAGQPWQLRLRWKEAGAGGVFSHTDGATAGGVWRSPPLRPGGMTLEALAADGSVWHHEEILAAPGMPPLSVRLGSVRVAGELTLDGEPLAGSLTLGRSEKQWHRRLEAGEDGRFEGELPGEGEWSVDLELAGERASQRLEPVTVERSPEGEATWLAIEVPDTRIRGRVVNEAEEPIPGVRVSAWSLDRKLGYSRTVSDGDGRISFRGLPPAEYVLSPLHGRLSGDSVRLRLEERRELPEVRLVVEDAVEIGGRVVSPDGPVAGAVVQLFAEMVPQRRVGIERRVTGPDGTFRARLPRSAVALRLLVMPPGYAARILRLPFDPETPLELAVADFGGTLVVDLASPSEEADPPAAGSVTLALDDAPMWLNLLEDWIRFQGGTAPEASRWVLPMMEVGRYSLCLGRSGRCTGGYLPPNGELELSLSGGTKPAVSESAEPVGAASGDR